MCMEEASRPTENWYSQKVERREEILFEKTTTIERIRDVNKKRRCMTTREKNNGVIFQSLVVDQERKEASS